MASWCRASAQVRAPKQETRAGQSLEVVKPKCTINLFLSLQRADTGISAGAAAVRARSLPLSLAPSLPSSAAEHAARFPRPTSVL